MKKVIKAVSILLLNIYGDNKVVFEPYSIKIAEYDKQSVSVEIYSRLKDIIVFDEDDNVVDRFDGNSTIPHICKFNRYNFTNNHLTMRLFTIDYQGIFDITYHTKKEIIGDGNFKIFTQYAISGKNVNILESNSKYIQFNYYEDYIFCEDFIIDVSSLFDISVNDDIIFDESFIVLHLPRNSYSYLDYSDRYLGYVFNLKCFRLEDRLIFSLTDHYYLQYGTFQISKSIMENSLSTDKIIIPYFVKQDNVKTSLFLHFDDCLIYYPFELIINRTKKNSSVRFIEESDWNAS